MPSAKTTSSTSYEAKVVHPHIRAGAEDVWNNVPLVIPALTPSRLDGCNIISVDYVFEVSRRLMSARFGASKTN